MAAIALRGISKRFDQVDALSDINLEIVDGARLVLLGRSGAGKTTLLRILCGLEQPDVGEVWMGGRKITSSAPVTRGAALVTQDYALYPQLTVKQNLEAALASAGLKSRERGERIAEALSWFEIESCRERLPGQLSGGQSQRVALAKAVIRRPALLLLDEPLSQLDALLRQEIRSLVLAAAERFSTTLVMVTHDPLDAMLMASHIAIVDQGELLQSGAPHEVYTRPATKLVADLLSPLGMNWFEVEQLRALPAAKFVGPVPEGSRVVGFRPEQVRHNRQSLREGECICFSTSITQLRPSGFAQLATASLSGQPLRIIDYAQSLELGPAQLWVPLAHCVWL